MAAYVTATQTACVPIATLIIPFAPPRKCSPMTTVGLYFYLVEMDSQGPPFSMEELPTIKKFLNYSSNSYSIRYIDGKGLGFVAVKELSPGERVFEENPIIRFNA